MTVASPAYRAGPYAGDGVSTIFSIDFYFLEDSHIAVFRRGSDGVDLRLTPGTDYSVAGAGDEAGGSVTLAAPPAVGESVAIIRDVPLTQEVEYPEGGRFPASTHERALDKIVMTLQQLREAVGRAVLLTPGSSIIDVTLPDPVAGLPIGWAPDGSGALSNLNALGGWRGDWATGALYEAGDILRDPVTGNLYVALIAHVAGADLASDVTGGRLSLAIDVAEIEILRDTARDWATAPEDAPVAPGEFSALHHAAKAAASAADAALRAVPAGGASGQVLIKSGAADYDAAWGDETFATGADLATALDAEIGSTDWRTGGTVDVVSNVATDRLLGRVTPGAGDSEELTAAQARTLLNVEDGATADQTGTEIVTALDAELGGTDWRSGVGAGVSPSFLVFEVSPPPPATLSTVPFDTDAAGTAYGAAILAQMDMEIVASAATGDDILVFDSEAGAPTPVSLRLTATGSTWTLRLIAVDSVDTVVATEVPDRFGLRVYVNPRDLYEDGSYGPVCRVQAFTSEGVIADTTLAQGDFGGSPLFYTSPPAQKDIVMTCPKGAARNLTIYTTGRTSLPRFEAKLDVQTFFGGGAGGTSVLTGATRIEVVASLPGTPDANTIYLVTA